MGFRDDGSTLIEIDSSRGIDGSNAITQIPDGYCDEMENVDINTKGAIKCRKGYQTYVGGHTLGSGSIQPVSRFTSAAVSTAAFSLAEWKNRGYEAIYGELTAAQVTHMTGKYRFITATDPVFASRALVSPVVPGSPTNTDQYVGNNGGVACKLSDYSALVRQDSDWATLRENSFPVRILCADTGYTFTTRVESTYRYITITSAAPIEFPVSAEFCGAGITEGSSNVTLINEFTVDVRFTAANFPADFVLTPAFYLFVTTAGAYAGNPLSSNKMAHYESSRVQGIGSFTSPLGEEILTIAKAGKLYAKSPNMYGVSQTAITIVVGLNPASSITAVDGMYSLTMNKADSLGTEYYENQDTIILTDSLGNSKYFTCVSKVIGSTTVTLILVPDEVGYPTTINLTVGSQVHFIRNSDSMYAYTTAVTPSQQMAFRQSTNQYDVTERTFVFLGTGKWKNTRGMDTRYNLYYSAEYLQVGQLDARPNIEDNVPIATLNSTAYVSHPTGGLHAYTGNKLPSSDYSTEILNLSELLPPVIQSWRSVPGTKSVIDCDVGQNGERADVKMEFIFTYQIRDGLGRVFESGSSEKADGIFMAKPTADGTAYTENIEVVFRPPVFNPGDRWVGMRLVAYLRAIYGEENSEDLGYVQYETTMPVPLSYNQTDVPRLAMTLGRTSIDAIIGNPKFVEQQGAKPNISAPTARLLVEHGGRLVAGDITAPSRTEISVGGFLADGTPPYLKTAEFCTVPFGLKELGGVLRPYKNQAEASISDYSFRTAKVKWWDSSVSTSGITVEYNDLSNEFKATFLPLLTQGSTSRPSVKYIFRPASQGDTDFSIPLTSSTFSEVKEVVDTRNPNSGMSIPNTFTFRSTKKCTETLLADGTCPDIDKISMFPMANVADITEEEVSNGTAFLTVSSGSLYYYVKLKKNSDGFYEPTAWAPYQTLTFDPYVGGDLLLAFIGPKTLFNLSYDNTGIKNFDTDLLFYASAEDFSLEASKPKVQLNGEMYYRYRLIPVNVSLVSDPFIAVPPTPNTPDWAMYVDESDVKKKTEFEVGAELSTQKYSMSIFAAPMSYTGNIGEVTGKNGYILVSGSRYSTYPNTTQTSGTRPVVFSGFSNVSEVISISKSPVGSLLTDVAVNDFITLELDEEDIKRLPTNCPVIGSTTYRVVSTGISSIQIAARADENQKSSIPNFSLATTGSTSCVVKLKKLFQKVGNDVKIPIDSSLADSWYTNAGKLFLLVRGDEDSTTSLRCSGHYSYSYSIDGGLVSYTLTTGENGQRTAFDYSQISGVRNSYVIAIEGTSAQLPVPVPMSVNSEYLQDLASPVFNSDVVPGSIYHAVSRRIAAIQGFISEGSGELGVSVETGKVYGIGTANRWEDSTKGAIIYSNNGASYEYIPPVRYKNRIQWTNKILATQQNSNLMPMFKYESLQDIYTGDDSEITGLASVQNTLLVAKRGALFRAIFDADDVMTLQRIQSPVGAYGMYNIPTTLSYAYFLNPTGVYYTDGNSVENVFKLSKRFRDNVLKYPELMNKCSGYVDHTNKVMHLGVPYASRFYYAGAEAFGQFVYSYNDGVMGWSVNTGIPATCWVRHDGQHVFGTVDGRVCTTLSNVEGPRAYADDGRAIKYAMRTRFVDGGDKVRFKFYRSAIFQFGTEGDVDFSTYYSTNYNNTEYPFQTYQIEGDNANGSMWRGDKFLKTLRETVAARVAQLAFTIVASVRYSSAPIYGIFLEGFKTNTRPIDQKNTPGNTRT